MDLNVVVLKGRLVRDPDIKTIPSGKQVCDFSIAVNHTKEKASFFNCTAWEKTAETIQKYLHKGDAVLIRGELEQQSWEKDGEKKSVVKINVREFNFLPKGQKSESSEPSYEPSPIISDDGVPF